jgi:glycosyltransferase involved in cell wall biosynthesis
MKLNWFSPLPPARTGIAQYTMGLLPALQRRAEIVLWTDQAEWDPLLEKYGAVRYYQPEQMPWAEINRADMSIYHIGNNPSGHGSIWQVSRSHQGIVVLHDLSLQHLFAGLFRDYWHDRDGYLAHMEMHYDWEGRLAAEAFWNGKLSIMSMSEHFPLTALAVQGALGVLVHTQEGLLVQRQENPCPVAYLPLPYAPSQPSRLNRPQFGVRQAGGPPYRIITFGYLNVNRRLDSLLQALSTLPDGDLFRLDIYGYVWDSEYIRTQIQTFGLQGLVKLHGFVPAEELDAALAAAHLAVNLRNPTMGESSFSQLQIWDHALPTLVSQAAWYAKLPESAVVFVRPDHEVLDIQRHLHTFLADPDRFWEMGAQGRHFLEEYHSPEMYADAIIGFVADAQRFSPQAAAYELAIRVGTAMHAWIGLPAPRIVSHMWDQGGGFRQQQRAGQQQATTLEAIRKAVTSHVGKLHRQQTTTLGALQQTVEAQIERLHRPPDRQLRKSLNNVQRNDVID